MDGYKHYIRVDANNIVIHAFSDAFEQPQDGDICVATDAGRHYNPQLTNEQGRYIYKYVDGQMVERSIDELYPLDYYKSKKKAEISAAVQSKIVAGYQSTIILASTGKAHFYGTKIDDQININAEYAGMMGNPEQTTVEFRTQDELDFVVHTRDEFKTIAEAIKARIKNYLGQGYVLYRQLEAAQTIEDVDVIVVDIVDPS
jgi:hypothetical protein